MAFLSKVELLFSWSNWKAAKIPLESGIFY